MALTKMNFSPAIGLRDTTAYPTLPANETAAREQIQGRLDEIQDFLNDTMTVEVDAHLAETTQKFSEVDADLIEINTDLENKKYKVSALAGLSLQLDMENRSCAMQVLGDSTGDGSTDWVYLLADWLADNYPDWNIVYRLWSDASQNYLAPAIFNDPAAGLTKIGGGTNTRIYPIASTVHIVGDMDIAVKLSLPDWSPSVAVTPVAKYNSTAGTRGWYFSILTDGKLSFIWSNDGTALNTHTSTVALSFIADAVKWVRMTYDADNGAGGSNVTFYTSDDGITWSQLGDVVTVAVTGGVFDYATDYTIGGRGINGEVLSTGGYIYELYVKDGIDGHCIVPVMPDLWNDRGTGLSHVVSGAPTLTIVNGSKSGANLAYLGDTTRIKKLTPDYGQSVVFLSDSHNEGYNINKFFRVAYAAMIDTIANRLPQVPTVAIAQNPQLPASPMYKEHAVRRANIFEVAKIKGCEAIDVYGAFPADPTPYMADSVHPNADGSTLWRDTIIAAIP